MEKPAISRKSIIKCPHCNYEYLPCEIFMPGELIGKPTDIIRDALGKIIYTEFKENWEPEQTASYICDNCNKQFLVEPTITYKAKKEEDVLDFSNTVVSLL